MASKASLRGKKFDLSRFLFLFQASIQTTAVRTQATTALSALTSQVNLIPMQQGGQQHQYSNIVQFTAPTQGQQPRPVQQRRRSGTQPNIVAGGKKRPPVPNKPSPQ